jgi:hypothetical protein
MAGALGRGPADHAMMMYYSNESDTTELALHVLCNGGMARGFGGPTTRAHRGVASRVF